MNQITEPHEFKRVSQPGHGESQDQVSHSQVTLTAINLLGRSLYSTHKLKLKLLQKGFEESDIEQSLDYLQQNRLLRQDWYIEARIKGLITKNYGPYYIQAKMAQECCPVTLDQIHFFYKEKQTSPEKQISTLIRKLSKDKGQTQMISYLLAKGHDYEMIMNHLKYPTSH